MKTPSLPSTNYANDTERVLIAAATAINADQYWYCRGNDLNHLVPIYSGKLGPDGTLERRYTKEPYSGPLLKHYQGDRPIPAEAPPANLESQLTERTMIHIKVDDDQGHPKGFVLLHRPLKRAFGAEGPIKPIARQIAEHIVEANTAYIDPQGPIPKPSRRTQLKFINKLGDLIVRKGLHEYHHESEYHVERMTKLAVALAKEITTNPALPLTITDFNLHMFDGLARLHDADKLQVPLSILNGGRIDRSSPEWRRMQDHAFNTGEILAVPLLDTAKGREIATMIASHHMFAASHPIYSKDRNYPFGWGETAKPASGWPEETQSRDGSPFEGTQFSAGDHFPPYVNAKAYYNGEKVKITLPFEVSLMQMVDIFEGMTGVRGYQRNGFVKNEKAHPADVLEKMHKMALAEEINPYLFHYFVQSKTLAHYVKSHGHIDHALPERKHFTTVRTEILNDENLQRLAKEYSTGWKTLLFECDPNCEPHLPRVENMPSQTPPNGIKSLTDTMKSPKR